ncbi:MAG TPA: TGS domain-containing protein [Candidatus Limnocylindria bacterium]|nr:TGS domain-containing protein [Candidatus Limnocylindria bacterium]
MFVFTPKGDIINLQKESTPLDFAYRIHSHVGNTCVGAKVNGKMVPLATTLQTGDQVEVLTSSNSRGPSLDWLNVVKSQQAKAKIRQYFKKELRGENVQKGRDILEHEAKRRGLKLGELTKADYVEPLLKKYTFPDLESLFGAVGYGGIPSAYVVTKLVEEQKRLTEAAAPKKPTLPDPKDIRQQGKPTHGVYVEGGSGMLVRFAHCCSPVPGDDIAGYITRGRGVTIHKADCVNAVNTEPERLIHVSWAAEDAGTFNTGLKVIVHDSPNILGEIMMFIANAGTVVVAGSQEEPKKGLRTLHLTVQVSGREKVSAVLTRLQKRFDVLEAYRSAR